MGGGRGKSPPKVPFKTLCDESACVFKRYGFSCRELINMTSAQPGSKRNSYWFVAAVGAEESLHRLETCPEKGLLYFHSERRVTSRL